MTDVFRLGRDDGDGAFRHRVRDDAEDGTGT
jgi:hypothetical protein